MEAIDLQDVQGSGQRYKKRGHLQEIGTTIPNSRLECNKEPAKDIRFYEQRFWKLEK